MKTLALIFALPLSSCAFVQTHVAQIALVGTVAGAVAATEGAVINTITLKEKLTEDK